MSVWVLVQIVLNVLVLLGFSIIWLRLKRPPKDDPRLSRGLQLLQSKITVLEDLSDRTDRQVSQLTSLLDQKTRLLQSKIFDAEAQIQKVQGSMDRSLEVAEIFQDKIPHDEIIERQNTVKYIRAARMAHSGDSVDDIIQEVGLPREQVEFIAKVNREKLMFDDEKLPAWAQKKVLNSQVDFEMENADFGSEPLQEDTKSQSPAMTTDQYVSQYNIDPSAFDLPQENFDSLKKLGDEFRHACETYDHESDKKGSQELASEEMRQSQIYSAAKKATQKLVDGVSDFIHDPFHSESAEDSQPASGISASQKPTESTQEPQKPKIQRVVFPRIDLDDSLG